MKKLDLGTIIAIFAFVAIASCSSFKPQSRDCEQRALELYNADNWIKESMRTLETTKCGENDGPECQKLWDEAKKNLNEDLNEYSKNVEAYVNSCPDRDVGKAKKNDL